MQWSFENLIMFWKPRAPRFAELCREWGYGIFAVEGWNPLGMEPAPRLD